MLLNDCFLLLGCRYLANDFLTLGDTDALGESRALDYVP